MTGKFPRRGEVFWVSLDPSVGSETKKTRPCLVVSNDKGNEVSDMVIVAPITSKVKKIYSFEVGVSIAGKAGKIMLNQCCVIDKSRIGKKESLLNSDTMGQVDEALKIVFALS